MHKFLWFVCLFHAHLFRILRHLLYNGKNTMQAWGLIVLLISKAAGHAPTVPDMDQDKSAGVLHSQRGLAEVTEMIRISHLVHSVSLTSQVSRLLSIFLSFLFLFYF